MTSRAASLVVLIVAIVGTSLANAVYARRFRAPYPARLTVGSDLRLVPGMMILMAIACVGDRKPDR